MASVAHIIRRRRRREARRAVEQSRRRTWLGAVIVLISLLIVLPTGAAVGGTALLYWQASAGLPTPETSIALGPLAGTTELYDRTGEVLLYSVEDPLGDDRRWVTLAELPSYVVDATLVWEDPDFMTSTAFDVATTVSRLWAGVFEGRVPPDASLTARLVQNVALGAPQTSGTYDPTREVVLAAEINRRYSPEAILEWHLNTNYYGNDAYGIEAAAQVYLGKAAADLTLDEAALLAAIPLAPQYNPFDNEPAARGRQQDVLRALARAERITPAQFESASSVLTPVQSGAEFAPQTAPSFSVYAREQAETILDNLGLDGSQMIARGGLKITTTLDIDLYEQARCTLDAHLARLQGAPSPGSSACASAAYLPPLDSGAVAEPPTEGTIAILNADTGELMAAVGPVDDVSFQPGPVLQPFVYVTGFSVAPIFTPASMVLDTPRSFPGAQEGLIYTPSNPDQRFRGPMNLRDAMGAGLIPPAASVAYSHTLDSVLRNAHQIGLNSLDLGAFDLMLLERGGAVSVLDVGYAYSVFASMGNMRGVPVEPLARGYRGRDPVAVREIRDANDNVLWSFDEELARVCTPEFCTPVLLDGLSYLVNDILSDQETRWPVLGQDNALDLPRPSAVVNGITADSVDVWTVGYTPHIVTAVHLSRENKVAMTLGPFGIHGAAPVWRALMEYVHVREGLPPSTWERPDNILELTVCERSGLLPNGNCPVRTEVFLDGTQPRQTDRYWQTSQVNSQTGQLATANTPAELRSERVFFVPPEEALDWWQANNLPLPPTEYDTVSRPELFGSAAILQPEPFAYVNGVVDVRGSLEADDMQFFQLAYGQGLNPESWIDIGGPQTQYTRGESMGAWDTSGLDGLYSLRLSVVMNDNSVETRVVQVTVDNIPPTVTLGTGEAGTLFRWPGDVIPLEAEVEDNLAIGRVEFYRNGEFIGADTEWPYGFEWDTTGTGVETFSVTAFDAVGNRANSEITVEVVRAG